MTVCTRRKALLGGAALCAGAAVPGAAVANGDTFFEALEDEGDPQFVFYGSVKDRGGKYITGAVVSVEVSAPPLVYDSYTNILGRYRSFDVGRVIRNLGYELDPSKIDVSVLAPGYKTVRKLSMLRTGDTLGAFEVNFVVEEVSEEEAMEAD